MTNVFCSSLSLMACKWKVANIITHFVQKEKCNPPRDRTPNGVCELDKMTLEELEPLLFSELEQLCALHGKRLENKDLQEIVLAIQTIQKQMNWNMDRSMEVTENIIKMVLAAPVHVQTQPLSNTDCGWSFGAPPRSCFPEPNSFRFQGFASSTPSFFK